LNLSPLALASGLRQAVGIEKKRTKADRLQRQTEQLEKRLDRRPDEIEKKKTTREDLNQAAAQTVREVTEGR
jgi:prefoldin subunit 5